MFFKENLKMALESIKSNKMRSFLTMLGIIIGISSVIVIVSAGGGAQQYMMSQFESVGTTTVIVSVDSKKALDSEYITLDDISALSEMADYIKGATPLVQFYGEAIYKDKSMDTLICGGTKDVQSLNAVEMVSGRFFTEADDLSQKNVVVIDELLAQKFFGTTDVVGMDLDLYLWDQRAKLQIVGVCASTYGEFYMEGLPGTAYLPLHTLLSISNMDNTFGSVYLQTTGKEYTETAGNTAVRLLESRHGNRGRDVYTPQNMLAQMDMINDALNLVQTFVAAVAAISLVVGGIGVMNIMLVAVTERTREIGIRKSLGARTNAILFQFLTESAILTLIGGLIGLALGYLGSFVFCTFAGITPLFTPSTIIMTVLFSAGVGIFFGIYPARKAARLHPIDALRHD